MIKIKIREVIKKAHYWIYCPQCERQWALDHLTETPVDPEYSSLSCPNCGHRFPSIEKQWKFYDERPCLYETRLAKATNQ